MKLREVLKYLQQYAEEHPGSLDRDFTVVIYRGKSRGKGDLYCHTVSGVGWDGFLNPEGNVGISLRAQDCYYARYPNAERRSPFE